MAETLIKSGTKMQVAFDAAPGVDIQFTMLCTFFKQVDESAFLVSPPMKDGKPLEPNETQKFLFKYNTGIQEELIAGYVDDIIKEGIRRYWKIRRVTEHRMILQRADERLKVTLKIKYCKDAILPGDESEAEMREGMTLDISAGGMALFMNERMQVGELCTLTFPRVGTTEDGRAMEGIIGAVCWSREVPRGSYYRYVCGLQYRLAEGEEHQRMQKYVANIKKKYKL